VVLNAGAEYYSKLPSEGLKDYGNVFILDVVLATGAFPSVRQKYADVL
jgi:uracil phosphoribosyltransferase